MITAHASPAPLRKSLKNANGEELPREKRLPFRAEGGSVSGTKQTVTMLTMAMMVAVTPVYVFATDHADRIYYRKKGKQKEGRFDRVCVQTVNILSARTERQRRAA
eukprot:COSAG06_NODE_1555_length_9116_cov_37.620273_6_plen_106_part_00